MPSEKVTRILRARGLIADQIDLMSENEAWDVIYSLGSIKKEKLLEVCFTGFSDSEKAELSRISVSARLRVVTKVTQKLSFLCAGDNAGPKKLSLAREQNALIMTREQFENFLQTGEIPR